VPNRNISVQAVLNSHQKWIQKNMYSSCQYVCLPRYEK